MNEVMISIEKISNMRVSCSQKIIIKRRFFQIKYNEDVTIRKHKARIIAKDYS